MFNREQGRQTVGRSMQTEGNFGREQGPSIREPQRQHTECFQCFTVLKMISQLTWLLVCKAFLQIWKIFGQLILSFLLQYVDFQLSYISTQLYKF